MSAIVDIARRHRARTAVAAAAAAGAIGWYAWPAPPAPWRSGTRVAPAAHIAPAIRVDDPPAPAALPAWTTRPGHRAWHIAGRVVGERGEPIPALVHLRAGDHPELWRGLDVATDARGRFDFGAQPAGVYALIAEAPGLGSRVVDVRTDGGAGNMAQDGGAAELIVHACERVRGVVTSGGVPVIGARIAHGGVTIAHSGAGGRFELCATDPWLDVRAPGLALSQQFADIEHDQVVAHLWPAQRFSGRVVDEHGRPRAGVAIVPTIYESGPAMYFPGASAATTDADGAFALDLPDPHAPIAGAAALPRHYEVSAYVHDRFGAIMGMSDAIPTEPWTLTLTDEQLIVPDPHVFVARVRGSVVRDGHPIADAWVDVEPGPGHLGQITRTRADGSFELALEAEQLGDADLSALDTDGAHEVKRRIHVRAGQRLQVGTITLAP